MEESSYRKKYFWWHFSPNKHFVFLPWKCILFKIVLQADVSSRVPYHITLQQIKMSYCETHAFQIFFSKTLKISFEQWLEPRQAKIKMSSLFCCVHHFCLRPSSEQKAHNNRTLRLDSRLDGSVMRWPFLSFQVCDKAKL